METVNFGSDKLLAGISCRTSNIDNRSENDLQLLWERFFGENIMQKLNIRTNGNIISLYHEFESGIEGEYTSFIGFEIPGNLDLGQLPPGITTANIYKGKYKRYQIENPTPAKVVAKWQEIWDNDAELNRAYNTDFEVYKDDGKGTPQSVDIFIGIA